MAKKTKNASPAPAAQESVSKKGSKGSKSDSAPGLLTQQQRAQGRSVVAQSSSWTGKLPVSLLHEHTQKLKWNKVEYEMKKIGNQGFIGIAVLSWKNPKTQETITVRMSSPPSIIKPEETPLEARHYAATYALHRIASDKNIHMVLPANHKKLWSQLEDERKRIIKEDGKEKASFIYTPDPFSAVLEKRKEQEKKEKDRASRQRETERLTRPAIVIGQETNTTKTFKPKNTNMKPGPGSVQVADFDKSLLNQVTFPRKVWDSTVFIDLDPESRKAIESSIRNHNSWSESEISNSDGGDNSYVSTLKNIGFRDSHISESLKYTSTFTDTLEWLIFHIPEDDLPVLFTKDRSTSNIQLKLSKDLKLEYMIERLSQGGFSKDQIEVALTACHSNELESGVYLTNSLINYNISTEEEPESEEIWQEEVESLSSIYDKDKISIITKDIIEIKLSPDGVAANLLSLRVYRSKNYPRDIPGLHLIVNNDSYRLASYIRISIIAGLLRHIVSEGLLGMSYIFSCVDWLETNISSIIANPGPLFYSETVEKKSFGSQSNSSIKSVKNSNGNNKKRATRSESDIKEILDSYKKRQNSSDLKQSLRGRATLPAWSKKDQLVNIINSNKVCLITGETGSGKSTQIVQFILDDLNSKNDFNTNIVCTQPRRISTIGLAERISEERVDKCGAETGYIIRGENKTTKYTRLSFVTTGVLLRMIQGMMGKSNNKDDNSFFKNLGYIFIDEVHERSVDSDFLLIILKNIMKNFPNLKVVLMSATIDVNVFKNYFSSSISHVHIEGRTFPITDYFLDDILDDLQFTITNYNGEVLQPKADSKFFQLGHINYDLIGELVQKIDHQLGKEKNDGSILIFLPGVMEITKCIRKIQENDKNNRFWTLPLHSALSSFEQKKIFKNPPSGMRKIIASTNVAETSITIPDAVVVIDSGKVKNVHYDAVSNSSKLIESWASKAEANQRRGRAGRITSGYCYKLFTKKTEDEVMLKQPIPEIKRTRLENVYLVVKAMGVNNVFEFLKMGLDPPSITNVTNAKQMLTEIGALHNDCLTSLGSYLSILPTDLKSGKLLLYGTLFGCLESCLTIASIGVTGNPFITRSDKRDEVKKIQNSFSKGQGDLMAVLHAYNQYKDLEPRKRNKWLNENFLSFLTMNEIQSTRVQYISTLKDLGFIPLDYSPSSASFKRLNRNSFNFRILNSLITSSSYPQIARVQLPDPKYIATSVGSVQLDPDAKKIKFWIRNEEYIKSKQKEVSSEAPAAQSKEILPATRAFLHPSSVLFNPKNPNGEVSTNDVTIDENDNYIFKPHVGNPDQSSNTLSSSFVAYDGSQYTSKLFLRDITPTSVMAVLLFGGVISYNLNSLSSGRPSPGIVIDGWLPIRTWCKNGVLITKLRHLLDQALKEKLSTPSYTDVDTEAKSLGDDVLETVEKLLAVESK
ncbi:hypothetical protein CANARDRAFT_8750 [[Candida] arabinofermentans NRRL YB-2248]|uniref:RNA helicase n=1 Tax=[Candida] arabinofermentans NRRL YB-2248 TaxID=983967 RepID=A0A1E4SY30_9ASCO|nr:hypothetical protein CANARDRAFT_8750 [[Candida] arabinofermentans NRRL YB-2248]